MTREELIDRAIREGFRSGVLDLNLETNWFFRREVHEIMRGIEERENRAKHGVGG